MSLDGLRAWIGVVERKLTLRTRVFLILVAIAIGGAGAGIYLALEAHDSTVSEADLQALRDELDARVAAEDGAGELTQLEAEVSELKASLETLEAEAKDEGGREQPPAQPPASPQPDGEKAQPEADKSSEGASGTGLPGTKGETAKR